MYGRNHSKYHHGFAAIGCMLKYVVKPFAQRTNEMNYECHWRRQWCICVCKNTMFILCWSSFPFSEMSLNRWAIEGQSHAIMTRNEIINVIFANFSLSLSLSPSLSFRDLAVIRRVVVERFQFRSKTNARKIATNECNCDGTVESESSCCAIELDVNKMTIHIRMMCSWRVWRQINDPSIWKLVTWSFHRHVTIARVFLSFCKRTNWVLWQFSFWPQTKEKTGKILTLASRKFLEFNTEFDEQQLKQMSNNKEAENDANKSEWIYGTREERRQIGGIAERKAKRRERSDGAGGRLNK